MSVTNITQTLALAVAPLDAPGIPLLLQALDGQPVQSAFIAQAPLFVCTANNTAAEAIAFAFPGATVAGLNLASGESRVLTAKFRGTGATAAGCGAASLDFMVNNVAGTLTLCGVGTVFYGSCGATTSFAMAASIASSAVTVTVTTGTGGIGPNNVCELYLNGAKGK